jgi:phospholipid-transporting ATPase
MCKGADSIIQERLAVTERNAQLMQEVDQHLDKYAGSGLRTLLLAEKVISQEEYQEWRHEYSEASKAMSKRDERMAEVASKLEQQFNLVGATAIEDKLQDDVDKAISAMKEAGIRVWVLTGDKIETAINIGFSCQLLNDKMELYLIDGKSKQECLTQISDSRRLQINSEGLRTSATVVSGDSLFKIMTSDRITKQFLKLACSSSVLIACRMSPKQKADIVRMIQKHNPGVITLAIGDGANDVNMITAAHIGVGISGVEGQ